MGLRYSQYMNGSYAIDLYRLTDKERQACVDKYNKNSGIKNHDIFYVTICGKRIGFEYVRDV